MCGIRDIPRTWCAGYQGEFFAEGVAQDVKWEYQKNGHERYSPLTLKRHDKVGVLATYDGRFQLKINGDLALNVPCNCDGSGRQRKSL